MAIATVSQSVQDAAATAAFPESTTGSFTFTGTYSGNALADLLLGYPQSGDIPLNVELDGFVHYYAGFFQDVEKTVCVAAKLADAVRSRERRRVKEDTRGAGKLHGVRANVVSPGVSVGLTLRSET